MAAAMIAHSGNRVAALEVFGFDVAADRIADLRDAEAMAALGVTPKKQQAIGKPIWRRAAFLGRGWFAKPWKTRALRG